MATSTTLANSEAVLQSLPEPVRARFREAERCCRKAATLYDFGITRGLLLGLRKDGHLDAVQFNALFDRLAISVPVAVIETIPEHLRARYREGVVVPASSSIRTSRGQ